MYRSKSKTCHIMIHLLLFFVVGGSTYSQNQELLFTRQSQVDSCRIIIKDKGEIRILKVKGSNIVSLDSLKCIKTISWTLSIINTSVVDLSGFENFEDVMSISLDSNLLLTDINYFPKLQRCSGFGIKDCPLISNYDVMPMLKNDQEMGLTFRGDTRSIKELKGISTARIINLTITDNIGIERINGGDNFKLYYAHISGCKTLKEINGLNAVYDDVCKDDFGQPHGILIEIIDNDSLTVINAFHGVPCLKEIKINDNPLLKDINVLTKCKLFETIIIQDNKSLEKLIGFNEVESQLRQNSGILILGNWNLRQMEIFNGPCSYIQGFTFGSSSFLESLTSLKQVEVIQDLDIFNTEKLKDLNSFAKLKKVEDYLSFVYNLSLDYCNHPAVCEYVSRSTVDLFYKNGSNCNNFNEVRLSCQSSTIDDNSNVIITYPNPASHLLTIENVSPNSQIEVYDLTGRMMLSVENYTETTTIDISNFSNGAYIIHVNGVYSKKFIKID